MCKKGEPGKRLSTGTPYYTSESRICKYSNVTKIDVNFCEKGTEQNFTSFWQCFLWCFTMDMDVVGSDARFVVIESERQWMLRRFLS